MTSIDFDNWTNRLLSLLLVAALAVVWTAMAIHVASEDHYLSETSHQHSSDQGSRHSHHDTSDDNNTHKAHRILDHQVEGGIPSRIVKDCQELPQELLIASSQTDTDIIVFLEAFFQQVRLKLPNKPELSSAILRAPPISSL